MPIAVSIIGGEHIDATGSFNVGRVQQLTPTLQFYSSNPRNTAVNIRGIGVPFGLANDGIEKGVGIYVDDVYYSRVASATFDFLDVAQIEVLRGPQGTQHHDPAADLHTRRQSRGIRGIARLPPSQGCAFRAVKRNARRTHCAVFHRSGRYAL